jgi:hypothetical protein
MHHTCRGYSYGLWYCKHRKSYKNAKIRAVNGGLRVTAGSIVHYLQYSSTVQVLSYGQGGIVEALEISYRFTRSLPPLGPALKTRFLWGEKKGGLW